MDLKDLPQLYRDVLQTGNGPMVIDDLMNKFWILSSTFDDNDEVMKHREGQRSVVLYILTTMGLRPDLQKLIQERYHNADRDNRTTSTDDTGGRY